MGKGCARSLARGAGVQACAIFHDKVKNILDKIKYNIYIIINDYNNNYNSKTILDY